MIKSLAECPIGAEVTTRNGSKWLFLGNKLNTTYKYYGRKQYVCLLKSNLGAFQTYDNNFKHDSMDNDNYDIISITDNDSNIIYEEPICEMTLAEIEKALGKKIKIVQEEKLTDEKMAEYIDEKCNKYKDCESCPLNHRDKFCYSCEFDDPFEMAYLRENYKIMKEAENNAK